MTIHKLKVIDGIRGIAAFIVVLSHLVYTYFPYVHRNPDDDSIILYPIQSYIYNSPFGFMFSGTMAVYIFFILSGYILTYVIQSQYSKRKIITMSLKRYPRLMIPTLVSCVLAYLSFSYFLTDKTMLSSWIQNFGSFNFTFLGAIYNGTVESFLFGKSSYNFVLWTMQIELLGSFLIFGILFFGEKYNSWTYYSILSKFTIIIFFLLLVVANIISSKLGLGLVALLIGHMFYLYGKNINSFFLIPLFILGLYFASIHNESSSYSMITSVFGTYSYELFNFLSSIFIIYSVIFSKKLNTFFSAKIFIFMGKVSFSVYLIHLILISTFSIYIFNMFSKDLNYALSSILSSIITVIVIYIFSFLYYKYIDKQGMIISETIVTKLMNLNIRKKLS